MWGCVCGGVLFCFVFVFVFCFACLFGFDNASIQRSKSSFLLEDPCQHAGTCTDAACVLLYLTVCSKGEFQCDHGLCMPDNVVCDGANDCGDYSDERYCREFLFASF